VQTLTNEHNPSYQCRSASDYNNTTQPKKVNSFKTVNDATFCHISDHKPVHCCKMSRQTEIPHTWHFNKHVLIPIGISQLISPIPSLLQQITRVNEWRG